MNEIAHINLPFKLFKRGKVRDVFEVNNEQLLIVSTDRISAFDYVLPSLIPDKGKILNRVSAFWFKYTKDMIPNHVICDVPEKLDELIYTLCFKKSRYVDEIAEIIYKPIYKEKWKEHKATISIKMTYLREKGWILFD